ncbi:MAG: hypothetical protein Q8O92_01565 [Candidatus Latescibacter sp.]|nr:hypothetical protein [Candidatus Latescibacter sp.]
MAKGKWLNNWVLFLAGAALLIVADSGYCQLLFRTGMESEFYGKTGYNKYGRSIVNRAANPKYDEFGNYVMDGLRIFEWNEEKRESRATKADAAFSSIFKTNPIDEGEYYRAYLNNLVMVNESTKDFSSRMIVGNEVRAYFSPLTLDMAALNGLRWDTNFGYNNLTFVASRADIPMWFSREYVENKIRMRLLPVYLTGGHFERQFGIINVAANYVNTYKSDSTQGRTFSANSIFSDIRDSVTGNMPRPIQAQYFPEQVSMLVVKVEDGSRFDNDNGPRLYDIYPVVEGQPRKDLLVGITRGNWQQDFYDVRKQVDNPALDFYENVYMLNPKRIPQYFKFSKSRLSADPNLPADYLMLRKTLNDPIADISSYTGTPNKYYEVNGNDYLLFWFQIPKKQGIDSSGKAASVPVENVEFRANVANDYKISISEVYQNIDASAYGNEMARYFTVVKEASGNIKDLSNINWVSFKYGIQMADMIMGIRVKSQIKGFDLVAEFNKNFNFRQYPHYLATKYHEDAEAYYINVKKEFNKFTIGTEYFNIDPNYTTSFENIDPAYKELQNIPVSAWATEFYADTSGRGGGSAPSVSSSYLNNTMVIDTVDDNDDKDRFPDFHLFSQVRDMNGVFPGLDKNGDGRPDTNKNENLIPDWAEPFLLYDTDPDEYDYGDDFNNNHVLDNRENDDKPDYPYNKDSRGYHWFGSYGSDQGLKLTAGYINFSQIAGGGVNNVKYGKIDYTKFIPFFATVAFGTQFKKVQDTIQDDVFRFQRRLTTTLRDSLMYQYDPFYLNQGLIANKYYDPLEYRDSYVSTSFFETKLFRIPNLTIDIKAKYDLNHQNSTSVQKKNNNIDWNHILKADYRYYFHNLLIMPQVKFMARKYTNGNGIEMTLHEQYFYPILRVEYPLTISTTFKAGAQGFPGLNSTVRNLVNPQLDYDTRDYLFMVTNRSFYNGYDFSLNMGYQLNWQDLKGEARSTFSKSRSLYFIRLVVGMEPVN